MNAMTENQQSFAGDEAGDVSFRFERGASRYFVVALIGSANPDQLRRALDDLKAQNHLPADFEFKFHRLSSKRLRQALWNALDRVDFQAWVVVVDKSSLPDLLRIMPPSTFYAYFLNEAVQLAPEDLRDNAPLWLDEFDSAGKTLAEFKRVANQRGLQYKFRRIRAARSRSEALIQVADLVAGAVLRHYDRGDSEAFNRLTGKIKAMVEYPTQQNPPG